MKNILITVAAATIIAFSASSVQAERIKKERTELYNSLYIIQTQKNFEVGEGYIDIKNFLTSNYQFETEGILNLNEVGEYSFEVEKYGFTTIGEKIIKKEVVTFIVEDTTNPTIEAEDIKILEGEKPEYKITISDSHCETYYEIDDSNVDFNKPGSYKVVITAYDECGNSEVKEINIEVISKPKYNTWVIDTIPTDFWHAQSVINDNNTASVMSIFGEKWVFKHAYHGGNAWYGIKVGDVLVIDGISYTVTNSTTAYQPDKYTLYLNGVDIFAGENVSAGYKIIMKTCYSGQTNWVVTAD